MSGFIKSILVCSIWICIASCSESPTDSPVDNEPPNTFISVFTERPLNPGISRQTLNWWGDDPDGNVVGYIYTFAPNADNLQTWNPADTVSGSWRFTENTEETFTFTLSGIDTTYTFWVKAIDDDNAADPEGAIQSFPVINTRPIVEFPVGTDVPESTFTVATFTWSGTDLDGDDTIAKYQYSLDDTLGDSWIDVDAGINSITLGADDGLNEGDHVFYLRAIDIAGAQSTIIRMPRSENIVWHVREPTSRFLVVDDYNVNDGTDQYYATTLANVVGAVDRWDIKSNGNALEPPSSAAFLGTLLLFDKVFWYSDPSPNLEKAQVSLPQYVELGGRVLMSTSFQEFSSNQGDPLEFSPVDSLGSKINRITRRQAVAVNSNYVADAFPELQVSVPIIPNVFPVVPKPSSSTLYELPESTSWPGRPPMAVIDANQTFVFFGLPLAGLDGLATVEQLMDKLLNEVLE